MNADKILSIDILDSTKIASYMQCPRKFLFQYVLGWQSKRINHHLAFGIAFHTGLEELWKNYPILNADTIEKVVQAFSDSFDRETDIDSSDTWGAKSKENGILALQEYIVKWARHDFQVYEPVLIEKSGQIPTSLDLENVVTVKIDLVVRNKTTNNYSIIEHKTASRAVVDIYNTRLQLIGYYHALNMCYGLENVEGIHVDTTIFYMPTTRAAKQRVEDGGTVNGFERFLIHKTPAQMADGINTLNEWIDRIKNSYNKMQEQNSPTFFPKCSESCYSYGSRCPFYQICSTATNPLTMNLPMEYEVREWNPLKIFDNYDFIKKPEQAN